MTCAHKHGNVLSVQVMVMRDGISISVATRCVINVDIAVMRDGISISIATRCVINIDIAVMRDGISISVATRCVINIRVANRILRGKLNPPYGGAWVRQFPCSLGNALCILHAVTPRLQTKL